MHIASLLHDWDEETAIIRFDRPTGALDLQRHPFNALGSGYGRDAHEVLSGPRGSSLGRAAAHLRDDIQIRRAQPPARRWESRH